MPHRYLGLALLLLAATQSALAAQKYNDNTAHVMLHYAYAAYCPQQAIENWSCAWCDGHVTVSAWLDDPEDDVAGYVGFDSTGRGLIVFRGTVASDFKNWMVDINIGQTSDYGVIPGAFVHTGFLQTYQRLQDQVETAVANLLKQHPHADFYITGHSLGGALAELCAIHLNSRLNLKPTVWTFGEPRVGNLNYASYFDLIIENHWRVVNNADIVPHLPTLKMAYVHTGIEVWLHDEEVVICKDTESSDCSNSLSLPTSVNDHLNYYGQTEQCTAFGTLMRNLGMHQRFTAYNTTTVYERTNRPFIVRDGI